MNAAPNLTISVVADQSTISARASRSLHAVIIDEVLPWPARSPKQVRTLQLALRLAKRHRITLVCHSGGDLNDELRAQLFFLEHGIRTVIVNRAGPVRSGFRFRVRAAANLFSSQPLQVAQFNSRGLRQALRRYAAQNPVDLWQCEAASCCTALPSVAGGRYLVVAHHIESRLLQLRRDQEANALKQWYLHQQLRRFLRVERRAYTGAIATVVFDQADAALAQFAFGASNVDLIDCRILNRTEAPAGFDQGPDSHNWDLLAAQLEQVWLRCAPESLPEKGSGTVVRSTIRAAGATVPDPISHRL